MEAKRSVRDWGSAAVVPRAGVRSVNGVNGVDTGGDMRARGLCGRPVLNGPCRGLELAVGGRGSVAERTGSGRVVCSC